MVSFCGCCAVFFFHGTAIEGRSIKKKVKSEAGFVEKPLVQKAGKNYSAF